MGRKRSVLLFLLFVSIQAFSQGSWTIGYRHINTITSEHIGDTVRIDFNNGKQPGDTSGELRSFIERKDTGRITADGKEMKLIEKRSIYPDEGSYRRQYLEWLNHTEKRRMIIEDFIIREVTPDSLQLSFSLCSYDMKRKGHSFKRVLVKCTSKTAWIARDRLNGVMFYDKRYEKIIQGTRLKAQGTRHSSTPVLR